MTLSLPQRQRRTSCGANKIASLELPRRDMCDYNLNNKPPNYRDITSVQVVSTVVRALWYRKPVLSPSLLTPE